MRGRVLRPSPGLAAAAGIGIVVQVCLSAAFSFVAGSGALTAHKPVGYVVLVLGVLRLLVGIPAWRGDPRALGLSLALPIVGAIQTAVDNARAWVAALHGVGAIAVLALAATVHVTSIRTARHQPAR